jgi:hypothetical protein
LTQIKPRRFAVDKIATEWDAFPSEPRVNGHMIVVESRDFLFNSRHLSVRAAASSEGWRIGLFAGDQVATAVVYSVTHENTVDASVGSGRVKLIA